jgi:hypothetical protein
VTQVVLFARRCERVFDPEATSALGAAYENATAKLSCGRYPSAAVLEIIAKRIITIASMGERDPERLCISALTSIGLHERPEAAGLI